VKTIINARQEVNPVVVYSGFEYRKYRDELYLLKVEGDIDVEDDVVWEPLLPIVLRGLNTRFSTVKRSGAGLKTELLSKPLRLRFRQGGERFHPENRQHSQSLKKILQEEGVPPWERNTFPLLYFEDECIAVVGLWISKQYAVDKNEQGWTIEIEKL
jgi:tRNA(Ile)-lysidine synthase